MALLSDYAGQFDTADVNGTTIDAAHVSILNNGTHGFVAPSWAFTGTGGCTIESSSNARLDTLRLRGSGATYLTSDTHRRIRFVHNATFTYATLAAPIVTRNRRASVRCWVTPGMTNKGAGNGAVFDLLRFVQASGPSTFAVAQLLNGDATGRYVIGLHSNPSGVSQRVGDTVITPSGRIGIELGIDFDNGTCFMGLFDTNGVLLTPYITANTNTGADGPVGFDFGNAEVGTDGTTFTDFEGLDVEFIKGSQQGFINTNPIFVPKFATAVDNASTSTISASVTNCKAGDMVYAFLKHESGVIGVQVTTPNDLLVQGSIGDTTQSGSDPEGSTYFAPSIASTGTVSFTATLSAAKNFKNLVVVAIEPPSTDWVFTRGSPSVRADAATSVALATPTQNYISAGAPVAFDFTCYAEFGATLSLVAMIDSAVDMFNYPSASDHSAVWMRQRSANAIGKAIGTLSSSNSWVSISDSFLAYKRSPIPAIVPVAQRMIRC